MHQTSAFPKNGLLSGMILTFATIIVVIPLCLFSASFAQKFNHSLTPQLQQFFFLSILLMAIHKLESFFAKEYEHCPVYLTSGKSAWAQNPREAIFLSFVPTAVGMLFFLYLTILGPPWHLVFLTVWLAQGLHEIHHLAKSLARRKIYPGLYSSIAFVLVVSFGIFPLWHDLVFAQRGVFFKTYYLMLPVILAAFYFEDRIWFQKALRFFPSLSQNR